MPHPPVPEQHQCPEALRAVVGCPLPRLASSMQALQSEDETAALLAPWPYRASSLLMMCFYIVLLIRSLGMYLFCSLCLPFADSCRSHTPEQWSFDLRLKNFRMRQRRRKTQGKAEEQNYPLRFLGGVIEGDDVDVGILTKHCMLVS